MNIGVDLDDVMVDLVHPFLEFYNRKYKKSFSYEDIKSYNFWESGIGNTREEAIRFVEEFSDSDEFERIGLVEGTYEGISELKRSGEVFVITSRPIKFEDKTRRFLEYHFPFRLPVYFSTDFHGGEGKTKAGFTKKLGVDYFIDDCLKYATDCAKFCKKVLLFNRPWNHGSLDGNGNIIRINNWREILAHFDEIKREIVGRDL